MNLSVLQMFVDVMRQGNFAAVAHERNLDPSSVSRAIAGLEKELGLRLFHRTTRKLSPTEAGQAFFDRIEPLISQVQQAIAVATDLSQQPQGHLKVTASVSFGLKCIVPRLPTFEALYPDLTVELLLTDTVVDLLAENIDVAVRLGLWEDSALVTRQLMLTRYRVCASPDYLSRSEPIQSPMDIIRHECLRFPLAGFRSQWIFRGPDQETLQVPISGKIIISNAIALQQCAIAGMGLALLPNWLIDEDFQASQLVDVFPDYEVAATDFGTAAWFIYPSQDYIPLKVRALMDFLSREISG